MSDSGNISSESWEREGGPEAMSMHSSIKKRWQYNERCVDPVEPENYGIDFGVVQNTQHKDANASATETETVTFLPVKAQPSSGPCMCGTCASVKSCRTFVCSVLTCGLYRVCMRLPCLLPCVIPKNEPEWNNGFYPDIFIGGVKVDTSVLEKEHSCSSSIEEPNSPIYLSQSIRDLQDEHFNYEGANEDVDSLITRKLLEVFSEFEINELAKCSSDSMFLKRSQEISQLISDIVQEHNIKEQEAECRLVREIIRISTRKSKKNAVRQQEPQRDSGNDTWKTSDKKTIFNSISDGSLKISEERSDDIEARKLRNNSNQ
ncbi:keratinocyte differentiation factor 1 isoform X2 [Trichomycterus rosablanca]